MHVSGWKDGEIHSLQRKPWEERERHKVIESASEEEGGSAALLPEGCLM